MLSLKILPCYKNIKHSTDIYIKLKKANYKIRDGVQRVKVFQFDSEKEQGQDRESARNSAPVKAREWMWARKVWVGVQKPKGERDETARMCVCGSERLRRRRGRKKKKKKNCVCVHQAIALCLSGALACQTQSHAEIMRCEESRRGQPERERQSRTRANARLPHIPAAQLAAVESRLRSCWRWVGVLQAAWACWLAAPLTLEVRGRPEVPVHPERRMEGSGVPRVGRQEKGDKVWPEKTRNRREMLAASGRNASPPDGGIKIHHFSIYDRSQHHHFTHRLWKSQYVAPHTG